MINVLNVGSRMVSVKSALGLLLIMQKRCLNHGHLKDETKPVKTESIGKDSQKKESKHKKVEKERKKPCQIPDSFCLQWSKETWFK